MLNAQDLRHNPEKVEHYFKNRKPFPIVIVLDNLYDTFNIGSVFRIADALNVEKVIITGKDTHCPPDKQICKSSMNICNYIPWEYYSNILQYLSDKHAVLVCENNKKALDFKIACKIIYSKRWSSKDKIYIIVGNESHGINNDINGLFACIPMYGFNNSMNVSNALSIIGYEMVSYFDKE